MFLISRTNILFDFLFVYLNLLFQTAYTLFQLYNAHVFNIITLGKFTLRLIKRLLYCLLRSLPFLYRNVIAFDRYPTFYFVALAHSVHKSGLNKLFRNNASP